MDGIKTNYEVITHMDIDTLAVYLSDINRIETEPLEMKRWLEAPCERKKKDSSLDEMSN